MALADDFLNLVTLTYSPTDLQNPGRFQMAAELLAANPEIGTDSIWSAAASGNVGGVRSWLERDPSLLDKKGGPHGWEPLFYAAYARLPNASTFDVARLLVERGADVNAWHCWNGSYRFTVLPGVFGEGEGGPVRQPEHPDMEAFARLLLDAGADPNDGQAAYNRCFEDNDLCFELFLEYGLRPEARNNWMIEEDGELTETPDKLMHYHLIYAIKHNRIKRARLLIDHGADVREPSEGRSPYVWRLCMVRRKSRTICWLMEPKKRNFLKSTNFGKPVCPWTGHASRPLWQMIHR